jgi:tyrosyl-tRNA synthetase
MSKHIMDILKERGFIKQVVFEEELYQKLAAGSTPFYIGFDPTADSLHVGHLLQLMAMSHMQKAGHKPIALIGGGTAMVGDPSGRQDMRSMMTRETIEHNCACFKEQMSKFFSFEGENAAIMVNNADWLLNLNYIDFLRDIGVHFSVNRMLTAECFKQRLEKGLSFLEFNYMLMQGYDFLHLYQKYNCLLQCGGDDQWSNILAGADLIRRKEGVTAFAMTFSLLTTSEGNKMGKTASGALWLSKEKTPVYDFYQYFRNVKDEDVENCLKLLTYIDLEEIAALCAHKDERINKAKERLAFEVTKIVHGEKEALLAEQKAKGAFGEGGIMPTVKIKGDSLAVYEILAETGIAPSRSEAKRLISSGAIRIDEDKITDIDAAVTPQMLEAGFVLHKGKKVHVLVQKE